MAVMKCNNTCISFYDTLSGVLHHGLITHPHAAVYDNVHDGGNFILDHNPDATASF